jgi:Skp family chaperone for outer membrane proteins
MFGISAPRVAVRTAVAWYWRWLGFIALAVVIMMFSRTAYDFGKKFAGFDQSEADQEVQRLTEAKAKLEQEVAQISGNLAQIERQMQIERATYTDLVKQVKALTERLAAMEGQPPAAKAADTAKPAAKAEAAAK